MILNDYAPRQMRGVVFLCIYEKCARRKISGSYKCKKVTDFTATFIILSKYRFVPQYEPQTGLETRASTSASFLHSL